VVQSDSSASIRLGTSVTWTCVPRTNATSRVSPAAAVKVRYIFVSGDLEGDADQFGRPNDGIGLADGSKLTENNAGLLNRYKWRGLPGSGSTLGVVYQ
jgi:hypothetical protein